MPRLTVIVVWCLNKGDNSSSEIGDVNHVVREISTYQDLRGLALGQSPECWRAKDRRRHTGAEKVRCSHSYSLHPAVCEGLLPQARCNTSGRWLQTVIDWWKQLVQGLVLRTIKIKTIGVDHARACLFTRCKNGFHRLWPAFSPDPAYIGQSKREYDRRRTVYGSCELPWIHRVGLRKNSRHREDWRAGFAGSPAPGTLVRVKAASLRVQWGRSRPQGSAPHLPRFCSLDVSRPPKCNDRIFDIFRQRRLFYKRDLCQLIECLHWVVICRLQLIQGLGIRPE